jgi:hypothetical protein
MGNNSLNYSPGEGTLKTSEANVVPRSYLNFVLICQPMLCISKIWAVSFLAMGQKRMSLYDILG